MRNRLLFMLLTIIIFSFPSICFSELKKVEGEYCHVILDEKGKIDIEKERELIRTLSINDGLNNYFGYNIKQDCVREIESRYLEKVEVMSHTETGRKICEKVQITIDPDVLREYMMKKDGECKVKGYLLRVDFWCRDIFNILKKEKGNLNVGLIFETKIKNMNEYEIEKLKDSEEENFHLYIRILDKGKRFKMIDRRSFSTILEEQKLSMSGISDSNTIRIGKILNLDIIVLRILYDKSQVTKVLKVDTGEVLLFKTYKTETEEGWVYYGRTEDGNQYYYDKNSMTNINHKIIRVWNKIKYSRIGKDKIVQLKKDYKQPMDGWDKLDYEINFYEFDCVNNTMTSIKFVIYNDKGKILQKFDFSTPITEQVLPDTMDDLLLRKVCQK